jgi:hypothetical protein
MEERKWLNIKFIYTCFDYSFLVAILVWRDANLIPVMEAVCRQPLLIIKIGSL